MSYGYSSRLWACPYFTWDEAKTVHCEGGSRIRFAERESYTRYVERHCCSLNGWWDCTVARCLNEQYELEDMEDKNGDEDEEDDTADDDGGD